METSPHDMRTLFDQLGQPSDKAAILRFIESNGPLDAAVRLHEAPFWSPTQAEFLREAILHDADWAVVVDALNAELHTGA